MSDTTAPTACYWVCTNPACTEHDVWKRCPVYEWEGVTCGVCKQVCTKHEADEMPHPEQLPVFPEEEQ